MPRPSLPKFIADEEALQNLAESLVVGSLTFLLADVMATLSDIPKVALGRRRIFGMTILYLFAAGLMGIAYNVHWLD
jgi:hypothetical protein